MSLFPLRFREKRSVGLLDIIALLIGPEGYLVAFSASLLTQLLVTGPFMLLTCIPPLRPLKGWLVASQYFYKAEEGRLVRRQAGT